MSRGGVQVLQDISLHLYQGEHLAILGPNGCGKSTLLKVLTCELYPVACPEMRLSIFGRDRWDVTELRRRLGVVSADAPSRAALGCTGLEAVLTGFFSSAKLWPNLQVSPRMREEAWSALEQVDAKPLAMKTLATMSAGQQRRLLIARALVASGGRDTAGRMLLLDEPSNALDLSAQRELRQTLRQLAQLGTGILLITHRLEDILPEMDRVLLLKDGRILQDGRKEEVVTEKGLRDLFQTDVQLSTRDGFLHAW